MTLPPDLSSVFLSVYYQVKRSGFLNTALGRRVFRSAYFFYKRFVEDDLMDLLEAFPDLVNGGDVLDIGANVGYTANVLARAIPTGAHVYAFEPEPFNFSILHETANHSAVKGKILPLQLAVGDREGTVELWINEHNHADHRVMTGALPATLSASQHMSVSSICMDGFLTQHPCNVVFAKIDVQGYELAVCRGMLNTLRQTPDISVVLEYMPSAMRDLGFEPQELLDLFLSLGFTAFQVHPRGRLSPGAPAKIGDADYVDLLFTRRSISCV